MKKFTLLFIVSLPLFLINCSPKTEFHDGTVVTTNKDCKGRHVSISLTRGNAWGIAVKLGAMKLNIKPQISVWVSDTAGNFKQNLFTTHCFATQVWHSIKNHPDSTYRTSSLPYWLNKLRQASYPIPTISKPLPDAVTAATPDGSFIIESTIDSSITDGSIWCEYNSSFDKNEIWPSNKTVESFNGQPSLIYKTDFSAQDTNLITTMSYMGHGGETGNDGNLYENDSGITSAKEIVSRIDISFK